MVNARVAHLPCVKQPRSAERWRPRTTPREAICKQNHDLSREVLPPIGTGCSVTYTTPEDPPPSFSSPIAKRGESEHGLHHSRIHRNIRPPGRRSCQIGRGTGRAYAPNHGIRDIAPSRGSPPCPSPPRRRTQHWDLLADWVRLALPRLDWNRHILGLFCRHSVRASSWKEGRMWLLWPLH